jgi:ATP-binding cassette subfamily F protein 1
MHAGVVIVSHDARLILETNCELYECGERKVEKYEGDFSDYRDDILERLESDYVEGRKVMDIDTSHD